MLTALPADVPRPAWWVRVSLILIALVLTGIFVIAAYLRPDPSGMGTHQQLGLPPCTLVWLAGIPCPSCGMTTSFSHLIRGEVLGSLRANWVGTLLAGFCLMLIPYCLVSGTTGRRLGIANYESFLLRIIVVVLALLFIGWGTRLGWRWWREGTIKEPVGFKESARTEPGPRRSQGSGNCWSSGRRGNHEVRIPLAGVADAAGARSDVRVPAPGPALPCRPDDGV